MPTYYICKRCGRLRQGSVKRYGRKRRHCGTCVRLSAVTALGVVRDNGERDILHLCRECEGSIRDFARVVARQPSAARCDRCGGEAVLP